MSAEIIRGLPWEQYIQGGYLGSSALCAWRAASLEAWSAEYQEQSYSGGGSRYTAGGSALDAMLTGDQSGKRIVVKPATYTDEKGSVKPWNGNANVCKAWLAENEDAEVITETQDAEIKRALPLVREALGIMRTVFGGEVEYQTTLRGEVNGVRIQTRPDCMIGVNMPDLKYVNGDAFSKFDRNFVDSRYFVQAGLFFGLMREATGEDDARVSFLLAESGTLFPRVECVKIPRPVLVAGWDKVQRITEDIARVRESASGFVSPVGFRDLDLPHFAEVKIGIA